MDVEKLIEELVDSFRADLFKLTFNPMPVDTIMFKFEVYIFTLLSGVDTIRKQDLSTILSTHFVHGKELDRDKLLKDLLNVLS
jgi:hypothetical protein